MKRRVWAAASAVMMATTAFGAQAVLADKYPNGQVRYLTGANILTRI